MQIDGKTEFIEDFLHQAHLTKGDVFLFPTGLQKHIDTLMKNKKVNPNYYPLLQHIEKLAWELCLCLEEYNILSKYRGGKNGS